MANHTDTKITPPSDLQERFRPEERACFAIVQSRGDVRLWVSTTRPNCNEVPDTAWTKYHITRGEEALVLFMGSLDVAFANFYAEAAHGC